MIGIISHDAGAAEILSCYVQQNTHQYIFVLDGPAKRIFQRKLGSIKLYSLDQALMHTSSILCGTSWESDLEVVAIQKARSLGQHSIAFLDHWVNYPERFLRFGQFYYPDEIWVGDVIAQSIAACHFDNIPIRLVENPYISAIIKEIEAKKIVGARRGNEYSFLYVCEPIRKHALLRYNNEYHWGYSEEDALRYFLTNIHYFQCPVNRIIIRPHPSEALDKYAWVSKEFDLPIQFAASSSLLDDIMQSDVVLGCESMALVIGLLADKRVISCIPPYGKSCRLPQQEIETLKSLLST